MSPWRRNDWVAPLLSGGAAVLAVHQIAGWWLDSGARVAAMLVCLTVLGGFFARGKVGALPRRACALWAGAMIANVSILLWVGPGTIWPIVVAFAGVLSATGVLFGAAAALILTSLLK